jgi:hypothetical protein
MARKLAPALVTGNTVVVKSSEVTPLTCARIAELWTASGDAALPPKGTYSVITGLGSTVGAALVSSPLVDIVSVRAEINISQHPRVDPYAIDATSARWRGSQTPRPSSCGRIVEHTTHWLHTGLNDGLRGHW